MDYPSLAPWMTPALVALAGLIVGYVIGARRSRRSRRKLNQELNHASLALLEARKETNELRSAAGEQPRRARLLTLSLKQLQMAKRDAAELASVVRSQEKRHYAEVARLRLAAVDSRENARKAAAIARRATAHLKRIEQASPVTQTIKAHEPKSYGNGQPVTVSVVDQSTVTARREAISRVSHRDSARLSRLRSSNEPKSPG